jgi:transitional endoplasmic reticulum ATPase
VLSNDKLEPVKVQMNKCIRKNLCIFLSGIVSIVRRSGCPDCTRLAILPFKDTVERFSGNVFDMFLRFCFASIYHPIRRLDTVSAGIRTVEFQISECEPGEGCSVTPNTEIHTEEEPLECKDEEEPAANRYGTSRCRRGWPTRYLRSPFIRVTVRN